MRLTRFTDLGLRALMRMASDPRRAFSTGELAAEFDVSRHHLTKAVATLAAAGIVETRRGTGGGAALAHPPATLRLGDVVATLEDGSALVECYQADGGACRLTPACRLKGMLGEARAQFLNHLNGFTLADCALPALDTKEPGDDHP